MPLDNKQKFILINFATGLVRDAQSLKELEQTIELAAKEADADESFADGEMKQWVEDNLCAYQVTRDIKFSANQKIEVNLVLGAG